jgi:hypothetical protein
MPYGIAYQKKGEPCMVGDYGNVLGLSLMDIARAILQEFSKAEVEALIEDLQEGLKLK